MHFIKKILRFINPDYMLSGLFEIFCFYLNKLNEFIVCSLFYKNMHKYI